MSKHRFQDLSLFPDCIALLLNGRCTRLNVSNCQGQACPFKRTREEDNNSIQYSCQRLSSLDNSKQSYISNKYYQGVMPWQDEQIDVQIDTIRD